MQDLPVDCSSSRRGRTLRRRTVVSVLAGVLATLVGSARASSAKQASDPFVLTQCEAWVAASLAQLVPGVASAKLGNWNNTARDFFSVPAECPWPMLPPESPWCVGNPEEGGWCVEAPHLYHTDDGLGYCYWWTPEWAGVRPGGDFVSSSGPRWICAYPTFA
jgi:hypothetical protein